VHDGRVTLPELDGLADVLAGIDRVVVVACGTAAYAGCSASTRSRPGRASRSTSSSSHEFRYRDPVLDADTLVVSVSQSGETMDTLMAVKYARERGARTLSICNTQGATIPRESDAVLYTHAGPEVAVASTKAFVAQVTALYLLGLHLGGCAGRSSDEPIAQQLAELEAVPTSSRRSWSRVERIEQLAHWMGDTQSVLFLGVHVGSRSRSRARSSSRSSPTSTPRASPPASSSTADRAHRAGQSCSSSCRPARPVARCTRRSSPTSRRSAPAAPG
jgi:glucosamine--fructose-6-phosphate aminotransferase (isomerizing)